MNRDRSRTILWAQGALVVGVASVLAAACSGGKDVASDIGSMQAPLTDAQCSLLDTNLSLVIHDPATIGAADFSFHRTLQAIVDTSGGIAITPATLLQSLIDDFALPSAAQPESGLKMPIDLRS